MGWTSVRTWTAGEIVTAAIMNSAVRDNLAYLKGVGQVPTIQSGLTIDNSLGSERLLLPLLSTAECSTVLNAEGEVAFDEQTHQMKEYDGTAVRAIISEADVDDTPVNGATTVPVSSNWAYDYANIVTTAGDLRYATAAGVETRLGIGTANQLLKTNAGATAPEWTTGGAAIAIYGDASDGNVTVTSTYSGGPITSNALTRDAFFDNLTIDNGAVLNTSGYRIFVRDTLTNNGTIRSNGGNGGNASGGTPGAAGAAATANTLGGGAAGGIGGHATFFAGGGGGGGGGLIIICPNTIVNSSGTIEANGGNGGDATTSGTYTLGADPAVGVASTPAVGGVGGAGGAGGAAGGAATNAKSFPRQVLGALGWETQTGVRIGGGGGGGGGHTIDVGKIGGGGGGGGGGGIVIFYNTATFGTEQCLGGTKGANAGDAGAAAVDGTVGQVLKIPNV